MISSMERNGRADGRTSMRSTRLWRTWWSRWMQERGLPCASMVISSRSEEGDDAAAKVDWGTGAFSCHRGSCARRWRSSKVCDRLRQLQVPFVTYGGFDQLDGACADAVHVNKPETSSVLVAALYGLARRLQLRGYARQPQPSDLNFPFLVGGPITHHKSLGRFGRASGAVPAPPAGLAAHGRYCASLFLARAPSQHAVGIGKRHLHRVGI
jgi:hypothetical protein